MIGSEIYQALYDAYPEAVVLVDSKGKISLTNSHADITFGYGPGELQGHTIETLIPASFTISHQKLLEQYHSSNAVTYLGEGRVLKAVRKDSSELLIEVFLSPLKVGDESLVAAFAKQVTMKESLETGFQKTIEEIQDCAIISLDTNGIITNWNKGVERIIGYAEDEIVGKHFGQLYSVDDQLSGVPDRVISTAVNEERTEHECWMLKKDKSQFWASAIFNAISNENGHLLGFSMVIRDLTERMRTEEKLKKQAAQLVAKNKELESFAYIASHDLQEPLSTITGMIELVRYEGATFDEETESYFTYIESAIERMRILIKCLLDYSRLGKNKEIKRVSVKDVVANVIADLGTRIQTEQAKIEVGPMPEINVYRVEFPQLFQNLISNALKFKKDGVSPEIKVNAQEFESYWKFSISDNGIGIKNEALDKIFIIFQRLHKATQFEGHGIGLSHCKKIVEMHQGDIWAESILGEGSVFYFTIAKNLETASEVVL